MARAASAQTAIRAGSATVVPNPSPKERPRVEVAADTGGPKDLLTKSLRSQGLATLVRPGEEGDARDEERYTQDLAIAIEAFLEQPVDMAGRERIAENVRAMTWKNALAVSVGLRRFGRWFARLPSRSAI